MWFLEKSRRGLLDKEAPTEGFEQFYKAYPRKVGKVEAQQAYDRALQRTTHAQIMKGLSNAQRRWTIPKYTPGAAKWLDDDGYDTPGPSGYEMGII